MPSISLNVLTNSVAMVIVHVTHKVQHDQTVLAVPAYNHCRLQVTNPQLHHRKKLKITSGDTLVTYFGDQGYYKYASDSPKLRAFRPKEAPRSSTAAFKRAVAEANEFLTRGT